MVFFFYLIFKKIVKSKWVERQFKCAFQKLDWFSTLWFDKKKILKKKKKSNFNFCSWLSFFYLIFKKIVKSKWVVRQFKSEFQKLVKSWDSILRICNNFAIKRLSPHCGGGGRGAKKSHTRRNSFMDIPIHLHKIGN